MPPSARIYIKTPVPTDYQMETLVNLVLVQLQLNTFLLFPTYHEQKGWNKAYQIDNDVQSVQADKSIHNGLSHCPWCMCHTIGKGWVYRGHLKKSKVSFKCCSNS